MTLPRISAYLWTCDRCHAKRVWPLERHPSPGAMKRARTEADRRLRCERCGSAGYLECFWTNGWGGGDQLFDLVEEVNKARARSTKRASSTS